MIWYKKYKRSIDTVKDFHHHLIQMMVLREGLKANYRAHQMIRILCGPSLLSSWSLAPRANWAFGDHAHHIDIGETASSLYAIVQGVVWHQWCHWGVATSRFVLVKKNGEAKHELTASCQHDCMKESSSSSCVSNLVGVFIFISLFITYTSFFGVEGDHTRIASPTNEVMYRRKCFFRTGQSIIRFARDIFTICWRNLSKCSTWSFLAQ